jgi:hypothetical protein
VGFYTRTPLVLVGGFNWTKGGVFRPGWSHQPGLKGL